MFSLWGSSEQPYRSTNITLQSEGMEPAATETAAAPSDTTTPEIVPDEKPTAADAAETSDATAADTGSSWWSYTSAYTAKLKEQAQNIDYTKITSKIGEKVNKESMESARSNLGSYFNNVYSSVKTSVESIQKEGPAIPMLSEFEEEQKKFALMQERRRGAAVPPWVGYNEEEKIKKQILTLSADERNVMRDPPAGVEFLFDMDTHMPVALAMLDHDTRLNDMRFRLVPKVIKEESFWRNYFYRVSLIKQSAQLATLNKAAESPVTSGSGGTDEQRMKHPSLEPELSMSPQEDEFISDHNYEDAEEDAVLNEEELKQMGLGGGGGGSSGKQEAEEWEAELEKELQDFEMVEGADGKLDSDNFEAELEEMLQSSD